MFRGLHLNESRDCFFRRGRGRYVVGPKTEKAREPTEYCLVRGIRRLRVPEAERRVREGLKTVTEIRRSSARDTLIAESVYTVLNFVAVGLRARAEIETGE